jgi:hypothetical protein
MRSKNMNVSLGQQRERVLLCLVSVFIAILFASTSARAELYDDFNGIGIDGSKWTVRDPGGLFSQTGDGQLHFYSATDDPIPGATLTSTAFFTPGFFSMDFNSFSSTNTSPGGQGLGSFAGLGLGTQTSYVRILRGRVISEQWGYFEANYYDGTPLHVWYIPADATSGKLGLYYDGSMVRFFSNNGLDGWHELDTTGPDTRGRIVSVAPGWTSPPPLFVTGTPGGSGATEFSVDNVQFTPTPEPSTMLLLGSGLIGLVGFATRFRK